MIHMIFLAMTQSSVALTVDEVGRKRKLGGQGAVLHDGVNILSPRETPDKKLRMMREIISKQEAVGVTEESQRKSHKPCYC